MMEAETCRVCGSATKPIGKRLFNGRMVDMVRCDNCGIVEAVATKDLPLLDTAFKCGKHDCPDNAEEWCKKEAPCPLHEKVTKV